MAGLALVSGHIFEGALWRHNPLRFDSNRAKDFCVSRTAQAYFQSRTLLWTFARRGRRKVPVTGQ
jgi:hypothetical protein